MEPEEILGFQIIGQQEVCQAYRVVAVIQQSKGVEADIVIAAIGGIDRVEFQDTVAVFLKVLARPAVEDAFFVVHNQGAVRAEQEIGSQDGVGLAAAGRADDCHVAVASGFPLYELIVGKHEGDRGKLSV